MARAQSAGGLPESSPTRLPRAHSSTRVASRRARVASCFALTTHQVIVRRYPAGYAAKNAHAPGRAWNARRYRGGIVFGRFS